MCDREDDDVFASNDIGDEKRIAANDAFPDLEIFDAWPEWRSERQVMDQ